MDKEDVTEDFFRGHDFEDRVLYQIVRLTGDRPVGYEDSITERAIALQFTEELNITPDFINGGDFHSSRERVQILEAVQELRKSGYVNSLEVSGPWTIRPTRSGRRYMARWRDDFERKKKLTTETPQSPNSRQRDAQEAWVEVAKLRRELQLARKTLPSLIVDDELRQRCEDLLVADHHYDRVIREACVILENRVRTVIGAEEHLTGIPVMELAFSPKNPKLRFSNVEAEQLGAMQLYRSIIAFFRNNTGHHLSDTYTQDDALRFVAWIDLLLAMVKTASSSAFTVTL